MKSREPNPTVETIIKMNPIMMKFFLPTLFIFLPIVVERRSLAVLYMASTKANSVVVIPR
jgi:hypothetical protein